MPNREELIDLLLSIDEEVSLVFPDLPKRTSAVIVGGSAFVLRDLTRRPSTYGIDVLQADDAIRHVIQNYPEVNSAVAVYMDHIPYNFEDRLVLLPLETKTVDCFTPSLEDLVVMKLYAWRPNDISDLESPETLRRINWERLDYLVYSEDEARASVLTPARYEEMVGLYEQYKERNKR